MAEAEDPSIPPPPEAVESAQAESAEVEPAQVEAKVPRTYPRGVRALLAGTVGTLTGGTFGIAGALIGFGIGATGGDIFLAGTLAGLGFTTGAVVGLPLGVLFAGKHMDGNGKWWAVIIGEVVGFGVAAELINLYWQNNFDVGVPIVILSTVPAAGAVIGYELSSAKSAYAARQERAGLRLIVSPARGGLTVGIGGRF